MVALAVLGFCAFLTEGTVANWSGVFLRQTHHASLAFAPSGLVGFSAGMIVGRLAGDLLVTRSGHVAVAWRSAAVAAVGMTLAAGAPQIGLAITGYVILGLGLSTLGPIVFALGASVPGVPSVWALSRLTTVAYAGMFVSPPLVGLISTASSLRLALFGVAAFLVSVAVVCRSTVLDAS